MNHNRQGGYVSSVIIALIAGGVLLVGALGFGAWAFAGRQDYKKNSDQKAEQAADARQTKVEADLAVKYAEEAKNPLKSHRSPDQFGAVTVTYPKTWSGYVNEALKTNTPIDNYFHPNVVPVTSNKDAVYALRVQVVEQSYDKVVDGYKTSVTAGKLRSAPYALPKVSGVVGMRLDGEVDTGKQGSLVVLPLRNLTLKVWTESQDFLPDFENHILPNLSFAP